MPPRFSILIHLWIISTTLCSQTSGRVYRTIVQEYDNTNYYTGGVKTRSLICGADTTIKYQEEINQYAHYELSKDGHYTPSPLHAASTATISYTPVSKTENKTYEGSSQGLTTTEETYTYTNFGNLEAYQYTDKMTSDGYTTTITYQDNTHKHIFGLPVQVTVTGSNQVLYRKVTAQYADTKYNPNRITKISQQLNTAETAESQFEYDKNGNLTTKTLPKNKENQHMKYTYQYDRKYNMYIERVEDAFGYRSQMEDYDYRYGIPRTITDMNGYTMQYHIDNLGRIDTITTPNEQSAKAPYTIAYNYMPNQSYAVTNHYDPQHPEDPMQTITHVDGLGRPLQIKKDAMVATISNGQLTETPQMIVSGQVQYDPYGRTVATYHPTTCSPADRYTLQTTQSTQYITKTEYDELDRPVKTTVPTQTGGQDITTLTYTLEDGKQKTQITDPLGGTQTTYTDGSRRTRKSQRQLNGEWIPIHYYYDPIGQLDSLTDAANNTTRYTYDMSGRKLSVEHPSAGHTTFRYDPAGNLLTRQTSNLRHKDQTDPAGNPVKPDSIIYKYDYNRLVAIEYPEHPEQNVTYTYGGKNAKHNRIGRLALIEDGTGAQEYYYGRMGEVTKLRRTLIIPNQAVATYTTQWKYDSWNRLEQMIYPDEEKVTYTYNLGGQLESVKGEKNYLYTYVDKIAYDNYEQPIYMKYGNGTETYYTYENQRRRLQNLAVTSAAYSGTKIMDNAYTYDAVDNITQLVNSAQPQTDRMGGQMTHTYQYDEWYRLTGATGTYIGADQKTADYQLQMSYDKLYNITNK